MIVMEPIARNRLDEERTGEIILSSSARMYEIIAFNRALDICAVEALNMEGGRTGRWATLRASAMVTA